MQSLNRLNVAVTCALYQLVLVGARRFFSSPQLEVCAMMQLVEQTESRVKVGDSRTKADVL